jgi:hypothetical protein
MQAVSGAGYPGVSSMDIIDNVVPFISGEEDKLETEAQKILGGVNGDVTGFVDQPMRVSAACNRVPVLDGHTACVSLRFQRRPPPSAEEVKQAMREYVSDVQKLGCPSAPQKAIVVMEAPDRPQPRLDRETDRGYAVSVGRIREDETGMFDIKFVALSHNSKFCRDLFILAMLTSSSCYRSSGILNIERRSSSAQGFCVDLEVFFGSKVLLDCVLNAKNKSHLLHNTLLTSILSANRGAKVIAIHSRLSAPSRLVSAHRASAQHFAPRTHNDNLGSFFNPLIAEQQ